MSVSAYLAHDDARRKPFVSGVYLSSWGAMVWKPRQSEIVTGSKVQTTSHPERSTALCMQTLSLSSSLENGIFSRNGPALYPGRCIRT